MLGMNDDFDNFPHRCLHHTTERGRRHGRVDRDDLHQPTKPQNSCLLKRKLIFIIVMSASSRVDSCNNWSLVVVNNAGNDVLFYKLVSMMFRCFAFIYSLYTAPLTKGHLTTWHLLTRGHLTTRGHCAMQQIILSHDNSPLTRGLIILPNKTSHKRSYHPPHPIRCLIIPFTRGLIIPNSPHKWSDNPLTRGLIILLTRSNNSSSQEV